MNCDWCDRPIGNREHLVPLHGDLVCTACDAAYAKWVDDQETETLARQGELIHTAA